MFVKTLENVTKVTDIQIQTGLHRLCFDLTFANDIYGGNSDIFIRLRLMNTVGGSVQLVDLMSLLHRLEIEVNATGEGFFEYSKLANGSYRLSGSFTVGKNGALVLRGGAYASLDMDGAQPFSGTISTIDHWREVTTAVRVDPFTVNGTTKDIDLTGVLGLAIRPALIDSLMVRQNGRGVDFDGSELKHLAKINNDLVSVDTVSGTAVYGLRMFSVLVVESASDAKITPTTAAASSNFQQYLLKDVTV